MSSLNNRLMEESEPFAKGTYSVPYNSLRDDSDGGLQKLINNHNTSVNNDTDADAQNVIIELERPKRSISKNLRNVILAILNVVFNVAINVSLPIYAGTMDVIGGDAYVLLTQGVGWFVVILVIMTQALHYLFDNRITLKPTASYKVLFIMGALTTLNGIFVVYASPPDRTPPYLQGLLATTSIPFTVICRIIWLRKGMISFDNVNPLYTGRLFYCYMLDESICHFRGIRSILSLVFYFWWKILLANTVDPDQTQHYVASDLGLHCMPMTLLRVSRSPGSSVGEALAY